MGGFDMKKYRGRIVNIEKYQNRITYIEQGVKESEQYKYSNYPGGNGTYVTGGEYLGTSLDVKVFVYDVEKTVIFDVYEDVKRVVGVSRISAQLLKKIESHCGEKIDLYSDDGRNFTSDIHILLQ